MTVERSTPARSAAAAIVYSPRIRLSQISYFSLGDKTACRADPEGRYRCHSTTADRSSVLAPGSAPQTPRCGLITGAKCGVESDANQEHRSRSRLFSRHKANRRALTVSSANGTAGAAARFRRNRPSRGWMREGAKTPLYTPEHGAASAHGPRRGAVRAPG